MLLLALDTATPAVTVALHDGTDVIASSSQVDARRHGELLLPAVDGVAIGFSAAVGKPRSAADTDVRTGGIRESREDGEAMWEFATIGVKVVVIP